MADPLKQFEVKPLVPLEVHGVDISFTNASLWMVLAVAAITLLLTLGTRRRAILPGRLQGMVEVVYEYMSRTMMDIVGPEGRRYFPFILTLFMFILFGNLLGLIPGSFTFTSQIIVNFALAFLAFLIVTVIGFLTHGPRYLQLFLPHGSPWVIAPLLVPVEVFSYFLRPFTLAVRLFANMLAGHVVLKVFAGFSVMLAGAAGVAAGLAPAVLTILMIGFEIFIAFLQAYIFALLTCVYLNDAVHMH